MLNFLWWQQQQQHLCTCTGRLNTDLASTFFPSPASLLQPASAECSGRLRPLWLGLILHFFSPRFVKPFARLVVLFLPTAVHAAGGERYLAAAFLVTAVVEALLE